MLRCSSSRSLGKFPRPRAVGREGAKTTTPRGSGETGCSGLDRICIAASPNQLSTHRCRELNESFIHGISLLHALSIMALRGDDVTSSGKSSNIVTDYPSVSLPSYQSSFPPFPEPPLDSSTTLPRTSRLVTIFFPRFTPSHNAYVASLNPLPVLYPLNTSDLKVFNLSPTTPGLPASVQTMRLHNIAVAALQEGDLDIPPPVFTRLLQVLSEGTLGKFSRVSVCFELLSQKFDLHPPPQPPGFQRALSIADTPFPFPYAQAITVMVWSFCLSVPFIISAFVEGVVLACVGTFVTVTSYLALNQVAREVRGWAAENDEFKTTNTKTHRIICERTYKQPPPQTHMHE